MGRKANGAAENATWGSLRILHTKLRLGGASWEEFERAFNTQAWARARLPWGLCANEVDYSRESLTMSEGDNCKPLALRIADANQ